MRTIITNLLFLILFAGCEKVTYDIYDPDQLVLFQREHINYAWGYQHYGFFVDTSGIVRSYGLPESWNFADDNGYITKAELHENFSKAIQEDCSVEKCEILKNYSLLLAAQSGNLTDPENVAADAGTTSYFGYVYEPSGNRYKQILIRQNGDFEVRNTSREAQKIYEWLKQVCLIY